MKRIIAALAVLMLFTGCGGGIDESKIENFDVNTVYENISSMTGEELVVLDDTYISNYYGIDTSDLQGYVFAQSADPNSAETVIIFKCGDEAKRGEYVTAVENAVKQKITELTNYNQPEQAKLAQDSKIQEKGALVYVVISPAAENINKAIDENL